MATKRANFVLAGTFIPDDNEDMINDAEYGAVVVHAKHGFNNAKCFGVIELKGTNEDRPTIADVMDEDENPPTYMTAAGARELAKILLKAADVADSMTKDNAG
jgi:hypothetical protein